MLSYHLSTTPSDLNLPAGEIHVCYAVLDQPSSGLIHTLSVDERIRAEQFYFEEHKRRFIVGRGILRTILGCYLSVEPNRLQFSYGKAGKPDLSDTFGREKIHFNLSHSEGLAVYAFARNREIGVDIEYIHDIPEMDQVAEQFFSGRENAVFRTLSKNRKKEAFFNCWTRKEAFIKAIGDGLSFPLDKFDVSLVPGEPARLLRIAGDSPAASRWSIQELKAPSGFAAAFAVEGRSCEHLSWQWSS